MPRRSIPFTNGEYYHIFNKTIDHKEPFLDDISCQHFLKAVQYYRGSDLHVSLSRLKRLPILRRRQIEKDVQKESNFRISITAFCLMPNHFHFLLRQNKNNGIEEFIGNLINSFTRHYNLIHNRKGSVFLARFHSVPINTKEQLLVTSRYIHRNPLSSGLASSVEELRRYPWSSYKDYLFGNIQSLVQIDDLLDFFNKDRTLHQKHVESELDREQTLDYVYEESHVRAIRNRISKQVDIQPRGSTPGVV